MPTNESKKQDALRQKYMMSKAGNRLTDMYKAFYEIMNGPNPLTQKEIATFIKKHPEYGEVLACWMESQLEKDSK